jgi:opacity protein-like surface antigen
MNETRIKTVSGPLSAMIALGAFCVSSSALADNPAGFYIGAGIGESDVSNNGYFSGNEFGFDRHQTAWKAIIGVRPIAPVGAELEYIDFGHPSGFSNFYFSSADFDEKATALFGVGYLPLPLPIVDLFGKVGVARLQSNANADFGCAFPPPSQSGACSSGTFRQSEWNTDFAYGGGVQAKFQRFTVRTEYERINNSGNNPDLFSVSGTWTF